jgi:cobalamin biosynthesis Mg chelatase CobN
MFGMRQSPASLRGRSILALSTIALLALSFYPALAQAQSSAGLQYEDAPPTVPGHTGGSDANDKEPSAQKANTGGGGGGGGSNSTGGGAAKGGSSDKAGNAVRDNGGHGDQQGSQGNRANEDSGGAPQGAQVGVPASTSEDDGSSPLVPILIAIAVLAAISIGVVVMRRRRQDTSPGSPASPEAG